MTKLEVYDPPMCCSTGICGSSADSILVTFASDLEWLKKQGVEVVRYGLSFEPDAFVKNEMVKDLINKKGNSCLPIMIIGAKIVSDSCYPSRNKLAALCDIEFNEDEAPPVHREENCCCGVDCDCGSNKQPANSCSISNCDCSNAPAEDNCLCGADCDFNKSVIKNNVTTIIFIVLILILLGIIAFKIVF